jgi:hypothetical protein
MALDLPLLDPALKHRDQIMEVHHLRIGDKDFDADFVKVHLSLYCSRETLSRR